LAGRVRVGCGWVGRLTEEKRHWHALEMREGD